MTNTKLPDETIDFELDGQAPRERPVELVLGSGPEITSDMHAILQSRLRLAALVMFFSFSVFAVRDLFWPNPDADWRYQVIHFCMLFVLGASGFSLCRKKLVMRFLLRIQELLVFGLPALFFAYIQAAQMSDCSQKGFLPNPVAPWLILMFTYALLIPNYWKRAAMIVGAMAITPIGVAAFMMVNHKSCQIAVNADVTYFTNMTLTLMIGAVVAVLGVRTIRLLRHEAFEARQLGQYQLRRLLGQGGMGDVYLAEHQMMRRPCVIKLIREERAGNPEALARFEREVQATAKLTHWNSVEVFDYGRSEDGTFYYVMEYLPGMNLQELVERHGPLEPGRVIHFLTQTCDALSEAHRRGLIHRDIKPANIFASERGGIYDVAKLLDFGLVKPVYQSENDSNQVTVQGVISGSPLYMSPEQALEDGMPDARSDIYSLGATAYFLVTGRPPFDEDQPLKVLMAHARDEAPPLSKYAEVPGDLESIILRCLRKDREDRFASADDLGDALKSCADLGSWDRKSAQDWWQRSARLSLSSEDLVAS